VENADVIARAGVMTVKWAVAQIVSELLLSFGFMSPILFR
jgi:hypothetical protein